MNQQEVVASADRGAQLNWGEWRTGILRADVVDDTAYVELLAVYPGGEEICVLQGGIPMTFPAGDLTLLAVKLGGDEPVVTLRFRPTPR